MSKLVGEVVKKREQVPAEIATFNFKYKVLINKIIFKYTFADFFQWLSKKITKTKTSVLKKQHNHLHGPEIKWNTKC